MAHPVFASNGLRSPAGAVKFLGHVLGCDRTIRLRPPSTKRGHSCNTRFLFDALSSRATGMAKRAGIGATVAAAVIFSIVLASSFTVYHAAQEDARLTT